MKGHIYIIIGLLSVYGLHASQGQGPLVPPGPPAASMKTLNEIYTLESTMNIKLNNTEPRTPIFALPHVITNSGSYYLTSGMTISSATNGIEIRAHNVTVDLQGFTLDGNDIGARGIYTPSAEWNGICIKNGILRRWTEEGIRVTGYNAHVSDITVECGRDTGIYLGDAAIVQNCTVQSNHPTGPGGGIFTLEGCLIQNCTVCDNTGDMNLYALRAGACSAIEHCASLRNQAPDGLCYGIYTDDGSVIRGCTAREIAAVDHTCYGIHAGRSGMITDCSATEISATGNGNMMAIYGQSGSMIKNSTAYNNTLETGTYGAGIFCSADGTVIHCASHSNDVSGIHLGNGCLAMQNNILDNPQYGIRVFGDYCQVKDNTLVNNGVGIYTDSGTTGCVIVCNTAMNNNTNYDVNASDHIMGTEATTLSTSPWANYAQ